MTRFEEVISLSHSRSFGQTSFPKFWPDVIPEVFYWESYVSYLELKLHKPLPVFHYQFTSRIHDIDAAGVMFFGRFFYHIHDAYESFLNHHQLDISDILKTEYILPISHTEADYKAPIFLNEQISIEFSLQDIKDNEFVLNYRLIDSDKIIRATALTHHICLNSSSQKRTALPELLVSILSTIR